MAHLSSSLKSLIVTLVILLAVAGTIFFTNKSVQHSLGADKLIATITHADTIAPVLQVEPLQVRLGERPNYRAEVTVSDNSGKVSLSIDSSQVDLNRGGRYKVIYTATDSAGNATIQETKLSVVDPNAKVVYLTFDDGPSHNTPEILKILKQNGVHATFFVTAQWPKSFPYIKQAHDEGHAIAAHSYSHKYSIYTSNETFFNDLRKIEQVIAQYTGKPSKVLRFPGGSSNSAWRKYHPHSKFMKDLCQAVLDSGYQYHDWNVDSKDAEGRTSTVSSIATNSCREKPRQVCILMHDAAAKVKTVQALPAIIKFYKDRGYDFDVLDASSTYVCHHLKP